MPAKMSHRGGLWFVALISPLSPNFPSFSLSQDCDFGFQRCVETLGSVLTFLLLYVILPAKGEISMAIRVRKVNGELKALCAAECPRQEGDLYLDDAVHHALSIKFHNDFVEEGLIDGEKWNTKVDDVPNFAGLPYSHQMSAGDLTGGLDARQRM